MYLLYLDESGATENPNEDYFVMGGLAVYERQTYWLTEKLDELQARHFRDTDFVEFHGQAINAHKREPWHSMSSRERHIVLKDVYQTITDAHESTVLFATAFHKPSFPNDDPVARCFEQLCTRFDLFLRRLHKQGTTQRGLMILDESKYAPRFRSLMDEYRRSGTQFGRIRNFVDIPFFADSKATRLLQLADMVSWAVYRRYERGDTKYLDDIIGRFDAEGGHLHGLVHITGRARTCMCPACLSRRAG